jgi:DnaJ-class molecular chaperone
MPNSKTRSRGDLRVKFNIIFPDISESERQQIGTILHNSTSSGSSRNYRK